MSNRGVGGGGGKGLGTSLSWQDGGNNVSIRKNCLNAEVHATRKKLAGSSCRISNPRVAVASRHLKCR